MKESVFDGGHGDSVMTAAFRVPVSSDEAPAADEGAANAGEHRQRLGQLMIRVGDQDGVGGLGIGRSGGARLASV